MNPLLLAAGGLARVVTFGHFVFGIPWFLRPVREAELALGPRTQMESIFHYVSVYLVLSAGYLLRSAWSVPPPTGLVQFIAVTYAGFAIAQLLVVLGTPAAVRRLFQWPVFVAIAACAWLAVA